MTQVREENHKYNFVKTIEFITRIRTIMKYCNCFDKLIEIVTRILNTFTGHFLI